MTHTAFFDVARQTAHAAINGSQPPALGGKLLTHLKVIAKCFVGDEVIEIDEGTAEFLILAKTSPAGAASLIDTTAALNTSDPDEPQYEFEWNPADSVQLRAVLDAAADPTQPVELRYEFRFERDGEKVCIGGPIWFLNNFFRPETPAPEAASDTSWAWLKEKVVAGSNLTRTVNEVTKVMTFSGEDSEANAAAITAHTGNTSNPHAVTKAQVGLGNADNTSDANKPVSTATQTALDGKQETLVAASQAEMETGTETALRSMSPLRVAQAVAALAASGGGGVTVVQAVKTNVFSTTSASWVGITDLDDLQITVAGASEKVLVRAVLQVSQSLLNEPFCFRLTRTGSVLAQGDANASNTRAHVGQFENQTGWGMSTVVMEFLDTPGAGTHSYAAECMILAGLTGYVNRNKNGGNSASDPRGVSTLTAILFTA